MSDAPPGGRTESLLGLVQSLVGELGTVVHERVSLLACEARYALSALKQVLALAVLMLALAMTAWVCLVGALVGVLVYLGLAWPWAFAALGAVCVVVVIGLFLRVKQLVHSVGFSASRRALQTLKDLPQPHAMTQTPASSAS